MPISIERDDRFNGQPPRAHGDRAPLDRRSHGADVHHQSARFDRALALGIVWQRRDLLFDRLSRPHQRRPA